MRGLLIAAALTFAATGPALATCYEDLGCNDSEYFSRSDLRDLDCDVLWEIRNQIYFDAGYCFKTERALDFFGDDECEFEDAEDLDFNTYQVRNISRIQDAEKRNQCG